MLDCYTDDLEYSDPNTLGPVCGAHAFRRYLSNLFSAWEMTWSLREAWPTADPNGAVVLWHATFRPRGGEDLIETKGMDLVVMRDGRIQRNEVQFDRSVLDARLRPTARRRPGVASGHGGGAD